MIGCELVKFSVILTGRWCTKWSKSERERQIPYWYHLYVGSKIWHKWTYLQNKKRFTDREQTCGC